MASKLQMRWLWSVLILLPLLTSGCATPLNTGPIFQRQTLPAATATAEATSPS